MQFWFKTKVNDILTLKKTSTMSFAYNVKFTPISTTTLIPVNLKKILKYKNPMCYNLSSKD